MNAVSLVNLVFVLSVFLALVFLLTGWRRALRADVRLVLVGLLMTILARSTIGFLEWSSLRLEWLDSFSDFVATLEPILWVFFLYAFLQQISERKKEHLNSILRSIGNVNQLLLKEDDKESLIQGACNELFETREFHHVWIALLDETRDLVCAAESGLGEKFEPVRREIKSGPLPERAKRVLREPETLVTEEIEEFCEDCPLAEECKAGVTITRRLDYGSQVYGLLSGCMPQSYVSEKELDLLERVTDDIAFGIHGIEVREAHRESERKYRSLFNSMRDAILVADLDRNIVDCNPAFTDLFGYELEEIEGKKTEYLYHESEEYERMGETLEQGTEDSNFFATVQYEKKDGEVFPGETNVFYLKEGGGEVRGFVGLIRDVTEKLERQKELERSEKRYRAVFETTGTAMLIFEEDTTISLANKEIEELTGYSKEGVEGSSWTGFVAREEELERMKEYHYLRREDPESAPTQYEFKLVDKWGNEKDVLMTIDVIPGTKKSVASMMDITERKQAEEELEEATLGTLQALNRTIEAKDEYTGEHIDRVQQLSVEVGEEMDLSEERLQQLRYASILHDIGKIGVPDSILGKEGKLTEEEWREMEKHPEIGERIVGRVDQLSRAATVIGQHQEKYDGSGYPRGLEGEELTLEARIVAVADAWDAMRTDRPYRDALPREEAVRELRDNAGTQFDPEVVDIMLDMIESGETDHGKE